MKISPLATAPFQLCVIASCIRSSASWLLAICNGVHFKGDLEKNNVKWNKIMISLLHILIYLRSILVSGVSLEDYYLKNYKRQLAMKKCARQLEEEGFGVRPGLDLLKIKMKFIKDQRGSHNCSR